MSDIYNLQRFVMAQAPVYEDALAQLRAGRKTSHWMWFVFPQLAGLGSSPMAQHYAIGSLGEAQAYLAHPVLGPRLIACVEAVNAAKGRTAREIFGPPDDMKFRSCLTLFDQAAPGCGPLLLALARYFDGQRDLVTLRLLSESSHE